MQLGLILQLIVYIVGSIVDHGHGLDKLIRTVIIVNVILRLEFGGLNVVLRLEFGGTTLKGLVTGLVSLFILSSAYLMMSILDIV